MLLYMRDLIVITNDMRSTYNVGSLFRTAEGLGVSKVFLTGITPYPKMPSETRLPHIAEKLDAQINKTALGATQTIAWEYVNDAAEIIKKLRSNGYQIAALEQSAKSVPLHEYRPLDKIALLLGTEVEGLSSELLELCDIHLEIPMFGKKESFNVIQAAAMALYRLRFY